MFPKKIDTANTILILGSPRSGTTWLMELLSLLPKSKAIFEPLNRDFFPYINTLGLPPRIFISPNHENYILNEHLTRVFKGIVISKHPIYSLKPTIIYKRIAYRRIIAKSINGNRLLPWIINRYKLRAIYLIIRHPCATILSQLETGYIGYPHEIEARIRRGDIDILRNTILSEAMLVTNLNYDIIEKIMYLKSIEELLAYEWCLDYYIPLNEVKEDDYTLVIYENLLKNGEKIIHDIFTKIEESTPDRANKVLNLPSIMSKGKKICAPDYYLNRWKNKLSMKQIDKILELVNYFELEDYIESII